MSAAMGSVSFSPAAGMIVPGPAGVDREQTGDTGDSLAYIPIYGKTNPPAQWRDPHIMSSETPSAA
jgi:hypothetical protein